MKLFFKFAIGFFLVASAQAEMPCIDVSKAIFPPCAKGEKLFFYTGQCTGKNEVEHAYCAKEEFTNLETVYGETQISGPFALLHGNGQMIRIEEGEASNCLNARTVIGQRKSVVDSYDPSQGEYGIGFEIVKFYCAD